MKKKDVIIKVVRWTARILSVIILIFGLPFYFGYGNPLPFINPEYTVWDNLWLTVFPFMFAGTAVSLKFQKIGGLFTVVLFGIALTAGLILRKEIAEPMLIPLTAGILHLFSSKRTEKKCKQDE